MEKRKPVVSHKKKQEEISQTIIRRENTVIAILLTGDNNIFQVIKQNIQIEDFKNTINQEIAKKLYEEFEKGNSNINSVIDTLGEEEQNHMTEIMADDYEINDLEKAIDDIIKGYEKDKLNSRKFEIVGLLEGNLEANQKKELEKELNEIFIRLAKMK